MTDALSLQIRRQLRRYLSNEIKFKAFLKWLAPRMAALDHGSSTDDLAHEVYIRIAEYTNDDWTEAELKQLLRPLVNTYVINWPPQPPAPQTGSSNVISQPQVLNPSLSVGTGS